MEKSRLETDFKIPFLIFSLASIISIYLPYRIGMSLGMFFELYGVMMISYQIAFRLEDFEKISKQHKRKIFTLVGLGALLIIFGLIIQLIMFGFKRP